MRCLLACVALALCFKPCVRRLDFKEMLLIHLPMRRCTIDAKIALKKESKNKIDRQMNVQFAICKYSRHTIFHLQSFSATSLCPPVASDCLRPGQD